MPNYQNTSVNSNQLILGNYKIETATTAAGSYVNLGSGELTSWVHNYTDSDIQAANSVDPIEYIADEDVMFDFQLYEYKASAMSAMMGGLTGTGTISTTSTTINGGGNVSMTRRAFKLTNTRYIDGTTVQTIITHYKGKITNGMTIVPKSDNDGNPLNAFQFSVKCDIDASLSVGSQIYSIVKDEKSE